MASGNTNKGRKIQYVRIQTIQNVRIATIQYVRTRIKHYIRHRNEAGKGFKGYF